MPLLEYFKLLALCSHVIAIFPFVTHAANFRRRQFIVRRSKRFSLAVARESLPCRENHVSREGFFYPCRYRHEQDCRVMLDENKSGKSVEREERREGWKEEWNACRVKQGIQWKISVMFTGGKYCWWQERSTQRLFGHEYKCLFYFDIRFMWEAENIFSNCSDVQLLSHFPMKY